METNQHHVVSSGKFHTFGLVMALTPPANAIEQSPFFKARQACVIATIEEEQAASIVIDGPPKSKAYEIFPLRKARSVPSNAKVSFLMHLKIRVWLQRIHTCGVMNIYVAGKILDVIICCSANIAGCSGALRR